jgi:ribose transport system permease protein
VRKSLGLIILLLVLAGVAVGWEYIVWRNGGQGAGAPFASTFLSMLNAKNVLTWIGLFGILSLAQAVVILTGGIDLSVGSVVALVAITGALLLDKGAGWSPFLVIPICLAVAGSIGAGHGLLVTRLRMQPFVVTLCGLFIYRGIARFLAKDSTQGFGNAYEGMRWFGMGSLADWFPGASPGFRAILGMASAPFLVMLVVAAILAAYLHFAAQGRHLFALGASEEAARFSGVQTARLKITAYVLCSLITGLGGLLIAFKVNSIGPSDFGNFYELYAIAGAVLGGFSLRGGTGNVLGVVLGISLIMVLRNLVNILAVPSELEYVVIGGAILIGVCADELLTRRRGAPAA